MRRAAPLLLLLIITGCGGGTFFIGTGHNGTAFVTTTGTVSIVQLTVTGNQTQVTVVTLLNNGLDRTFNFCGNVVNQFPLDRFVSVNFNEGTPCFGLVQVVPG